MAAKNDPRLEMIHPSYVELMEVVNEGAEVGEEPVVNSRYTIVAATAKRARQIIDGSAARIPDPDGIKPLSTAVHELFDGELQILTPEQKAAMDARAEEVRVLRENAAIRKAEEEALTVEEDTEEEETMPEEEAAEETSDEETLEFEDEDEE